MSEKKKKGKLSHIGEDVYEVERILDQRFLNQRTEYKVKWLGYSDEHNSWEPEDNFFDRSLIDNFEKQFVKRYRVKSSSSDDDDDEVDGKVDRAKSKKPKLIKKLIKTESSPSNRENISHSSKTSSKKRVRMLEDSSSEEEEEKREFIPPSSTGRSSTKAHKDKDRHHRKHKHRSDHHQRDDKHRHKSSKLLKGGSDSSYIDNKKMKKKKHKKKKHHEHDDDDILTESNPQVQHEHVQADDQSAKVNSKRMTFEEFEERIKGKPKSCTPITCNDTTFNITEYML